MKRRTLLSGLALAALVGGATGWAVWPGQAIARSAVVHKSPTCGCCEGWITYLRRNGYDVTVHDHDDMAPIKAQAKVPADMQSCHTALIGGYVVEGHVPIEAIDALLSEKPRATGIAAPGMPQGSPGMSGEKEPNPIYLFDDSQRRLMATY